MATISCPSCSGAVSPKAFDCAHCGHPLRKPRRGPFGWLVKWLFIAFNVVMIVLAFVYLADIGEMSEASTSEAEQAGIAIGATLGVGVLLTVWALGDVILGALVLFTRPRK